MAIIHRDDDTLRFWQLGGCVENLFSSGRIAEGWENVTQKLYNPRAMKSCERLHLTTSSYAFFYRRRRGKWLNSWTGGVEWSGVDGSYFDASETSGEPQALEGRASSASSSGGTGGEQSRTESTACDCLFFLCTAWMSGGSCMQTHRVTLSFLLLLLLLLRTTQSLKIWIRIRGPPPPPPPQSYDVFQKCTESWTRQLSPLTHSRSRCHSMHIAIRPFY